MHLQVKKKKDFSGVLLNSFLLYVTGLELNSPYELCLTGTLQKKKKKCFCLKVQTQKNAESLHLPADLIVLSSNAPPAQLLLKKIVPLGRLP